MKTVLGARAYRLTIKPSRYESEETELLRQAIPVLQRFDAAADELRGRTMKRPGPM
jgi:hypothetical protein